MVLFRSDSVVCCFCIYFLWFFSFFPFFPFLHKGIWFFLPFPFSHRGIWFSHTHGILSVWNPFKFGSGVDSGHSPTQVWGFLLLILRVAFFLLLFYSFQSRQACISVNSLLEFLFVFHGLSFSVFVTISEFYMLWLYIQIEL